MQRLSDHAMLRVWELGRRASQSRRVSAVLAAAGVVADPNEEAAALTLGERDSRLFAVRNSTFGTAMECTVHCPACEERLEFTLDVAALAPELDEYVADRRPSTLSAAGYQATVRPATLGDIEALIAAGEQSVLERCVVAAERDGEVVSVDELPMELVAAIDRRLADADPAAVTALRLSCPACSHGWEQLLDVGEFLWTEIAAHAERLLREVHTLASAYGWSESSILALGSARRDAYLELLGA